MRKIFLYLGCLFLPLLSLTQDLDFTEFNPSLIENAHSIIRKDFTEFEILEKDQMIVKAHFIATILNKESPHNIKVLYYDPKRKIQRFDANLYDRNGRLVQHYSKKTASDQSAISNYSIFEDDRMLIHELAHHDYPYTVEYQYEYKSSAILDYPNFRFNNINQSIQSAENIAIVPESLGLRYKNFNGLDAPTISKSDGKITYSWKVEQLKAISREIYGPDREDLIQKVLIGPNHIKYDNWEGKCDSWSSYGKFYYELNKERDNISPTLLKKVKALTQGVTSNQEKIEILYRFLQKNTRYVSVQLGIGGWQTFDAKYVEKNQYGDCKALSNFMKSLLKAVDIEAHTALIYSNPKQPAELDVDFPITFANHAILYIPENESFLECTSNNYPPFYIGPANSNRQALVITPQGGLLKNTPEINAQKNLIQRNLVVALNENGLAKITGKIILNGAAQNQFRSLSITGSKAEKVTAFSQYMDLPESQIESLDLKADAKKPRTTISFNLKNVPLTKKIGKRRLLNLNFLGDLPEIPKQLENRRFPFYQKNLYASSDSIKFSIPNSFDFNSKHLPDTSMVTPFGNYALSIALDNDGIVLNRTFQLESYQGPKESYNDWRSFLIALHEADQPKLILLQSIRP